jgi:hypothetical protein
MAATATKSQTPSAVPATALEQALQDRAGLAQEAERLAGALSRLQTEAAAGASLHDELAKLSETETTEMKCWAAGGCEGPPPKGKQAERQAIAVKMAGTSAVAAAALGAIHDVEHQVKENRERLALINNEIEQAIFDQIEREHSDVVAEYAQVCKRGSQLATKISGTALYFKEAGNPGRAVVIFNTKLPQITTNPHEVKAAADEWSRRAAALRGGSPS